MFVGSGIGIRIDSATIGIVGMGRIGYKVAQRARGFNMTVLYHNTTKRYGTFMCHNLDTWKSTIF